MRFPSGGRLFAAGEPRAAHSSTHVTRARSPPFGAPFGALDVLLCTIRTLALLDAAFVLQRAIEATSADIRALQAAARQALLN